jgi:hypothetical protein
MGITLDKNLFYRVRCGGGNPSSDLIRFEGNTHRSDLGDGRSTVGGLRLRKRAADYRCRPHFLGGEMNAKVEDDYSGRNGQVQ